MPSFLAVLATLSIFSVCLDNAKPIAATAAAAIAAPRATDLAMFRLAVDIDRRERVTLLKAACVVFTAEITILTFSVAIFHLNVVNPALVLDDFHLHYL